jgi:hypothetical protein
MGNTDSGRKTGAGRPDKTLAETAKHEAAEVGEAAASAAHALADDAREAAARTAEQGEQRAAGQLDRFASALRSSTRELGSGDAWLAEIIERTAGQLKSASRHLHEQDLRGLAREASELARTHPATFLGASVALGFAAARLAKTSGSAATTTAGAERTRTRQGASQ